MKTIIIIFVILLHSAAGFTQSSKKEIINSYLEMKNDLVNGNAESVQKEAFTALTNLQSAPDFSKKDTFLKLLKKMAGTNDIEKQRASMAVLSAHLWEIIKSDNTIERELYYNYCPMKEMYWISEFKVLKNPYYGYSMLNCGMIKETKK